MDAHAVIDFGGAGPPLHFAHANGYPPEAYAPLLTRLTPHYHVRAARLGPLRSSRNLASLKSWQPLVDDLEADLLAQGAQGWVGVGHSLGAMLTTTVALRWPDMFSALVLIEPVLLSLRLLSVWNLLRWAGLARAAHPLIPGALRRRRHFAGADEMFTRYRQAPIFGRIDDAGLRAYVDALAQPAPGGGVTLSYPPEWEVAIYATGPMNLWGRLGRLKPPVLVVRGQETDTLRPAAVRRLRRTLPNAHVVEVPHTGHLAPLEAPAAVAEATLTFLKDKQGQPGPRISTHGAKG
ncbi:MAG: alpha/beta hydrolase [Anaerolineales bacterium]|nr:alpha/beta hydrolase [Anaerolineales bacterium]